jgi:hypothetical protein
VDEGRFSISADDLHQRFGTVAVPVVVDARRAPAFEAHERMVVGAIRCNPEEIAAWRHGRTDCRPVVGYCVHGHEVSQRATEKLRGLGIDARYLAGGIGACVELNLPTRCKTGPASPRWVTRERPKVDRAACPWLVRRFIDPQADFLYVRPKRCSPLRRKPVPSPYDILGADPFSHDGELCSIDAFLKVYGIAECALDRLAPIVRSADTGRLELTPQSPGLLAITLGLSANFADDDHAMLERSMDIYDALYAWCRSLQHETHNWTPPARA